MKKQEIKEILADMHKKYMRISGEKANAQAVAMCDVWSAITGKTFVEATDELFEAEK
ncbi:MAG: hypothetical protein WC900_10550 [Oscillospiraceae bacterium]|jgi:hypothetical protein